MLGCILHGLNDENLGFTQGISICNKLYLNLKIPYNEFEISQRMNNSERKMPWTHNAWKFQTTPRNKPWARIKISWVQNILGSKYLGIKISWDQNISGSMISKRFLNHEA